ncbi:hypothetical protein E2562_005292 [Oryza meyeriana var. granulata]|uniref:Uncharacterized protein n=1 Tax=Oryza meyeriana var. granulata TaxID=110450 RepID=A0A6G1EF74_9ORYZ|nr:hypothetical protein E2562_005292 [Oryza meyeriana var. granulata]
MRDLLHDTSYGDAGVDAVEAQPADGQAARWGGIEAWVVTLSAGQWTDSDRHGDLATQIGSGASSREARRTRPTGGSDAWRRGGTRR